MPHACRRAIPVAVALALLFTVIPASALAASCPYRFGFADLKAQLGARMGEPTSCEYVDPNATGDTEQNTTNGLAFSRKSTNTPTFTNGFDHWALTGNGLVYWTGTSIDPPGDTAPPADGGDSN